MTRASRLAVPTAVARPARTFGPAAAIFAVQLVLFPIPAGVFVRGIVIGMLSALVALGMALVYRSNRILNFAQADLGAPSGVLTYMLITEWGWSWYLAAGAGLVSALAVGAIIELAIIRRFRDAPRLLLTVATLGLAQLLAAGAILLPKLWGSERLIAPRIDAPFSLRFRVDPLVFSANDVIAMVVAPLAMAALWFFLQHTHVGTAVRASAENASRAGLLGIRVGRIATTVWAVAAGLAFVATFLRAGVLGLPVGSGLGFGVLLRALAALLLGRLTNLPAIATSAVALGVLELGIAWNASSPLLVDPILALVIGIALLARRSSALRGEANDTSTWRSAADVRPIEPDLARRAEVRAARWGGAALLAVAVLILPHVLSPDRSLKASAVLVYGILGVSLVVVTGWAGQVSLGAIAFFAIGAAVGAVATSKWNLDLLLALPIATAVGAVVAVVVGLPALRLRGLYLAVTTFAFALATTSYFLNRRFFDWVPSGRIERPPLLGRISLDSPTRVYYLCLAGLGVVLLAVRGMRRSPAGRSWIALRENERALAAFGTNPLAAKVGAFAVSGAIAAFAGALFVHHQQAFGEGPYDPSENFAVFTMVVLGGVTSIPGALLGAIYLKGLGWFLPIEWQPVASGAGVLVVLMVLPGGLGSLLYAVRDAGLRWVAGRGSRPAPTPTPTPTPTEVALAGEP